MTAVKVVIMRGVPTEFDVWSCSQVTVGVGTMLTSPCIKSKEIPATVHAAIHFAVRLASGKTEGKGREKEGRKGKRREENSQEKSRTKSTNAEPKE